MNERNKMHWFSLQDSADTVAGGYTMLTDYVRLIRPVRKRV